jgi:hypothetical protein
MTELCGPAPLTKSIRTCAILLILAGAILRLRAYFAADSLSHDEVCVVLNLMHRSFAALRKPLDYEQAAPLGFLWIQKLIGTFLGYGELSMRLFPLLAGITLLPLLFFLLTDILSPTAALAGLLLAATEPWLIKWSVDVKPYSSDALLSALLLYLMLLGYRRCWKNPLLLLIAAIGTASLTLSYTSALVLAGGGITIFALELQRRHWLVVRRLAAVGAVWAITLAALVHSVDRSVIADPYLQKYWLPEFMPFPPHAFHELHWFIYALHEAFRTTIKFGWPPIPIAALLLGIIWLWRHNRPALFLVLAPLLPALLASGLRQYPFGDRLLLYAAPQIIFLITTSLHALLPKFRFAAFLLLIALTVPNIATAFDQLHHPSPDEEMKPILQKISSHLEPGDEIVLSRYSSRAYTYYSPSFALTTTPTLIANGIDPQTVQKQMTPLQGRPRIWIILMHEDLTAPHIIQALPLVIAQKMGRQIERDSLGTATLYLYDFSPHP